VSDDAFLSRWSRRKLAARSAPEPAQPAIPAAAASPSPPSPEAQTAQQPPAPLPPVESLTPESDFTPFMRAEVDPSTRRAALKTLFQDPQFNVMDGLDTYIADYSQPDPLPAGWLEKMNQVSSLGDVFARREQEEKAAAEALAAGAAEADAGAALNPPPAPDVPSGEVPEPADSSDPIEGMPTRTG
jgi:hypothetical protein